MSNLTWTDNRHNIPKGHAPRWEWENGATSTFKVKSEHGPHNLPQDAFWRITPIHTVMAKTTKHHSQFAERTMWFVHFGSEHNRWIAMEHGFTYDQEWVPAPHRWTTCKETQRMLFYSLDHAKAFCEQTYGFSTMVDTRAVV